MRNLLALLGAAVVTLGGAGWYLDWFRVHRGIVGDGRQNYNVELNTNKIGEDFHKGGARIQEAIEKKIRERKDATTSTSSTESVSSESSKSSKANEGSPFNLMSRKLPVPPRVSPDPLLPPQYQPPQP